MDLWSAAISELHKLEGHLNFTGVIFAGTCDETRGPPPPGVVFYLNGVGAAVHTSLRCPFLQDSKEFPCVLSAVQISISGLSHGCCRT